MSDISKLRKRRAYVKGSITSTLNQLEGLCDPKAAAAAAKPSKTLVFTLISDVEERLKTVDEFTSEICFELDDELMQEEVENNSKYVLSVKTQICMYRGSFPNKGSQINANVENCKTVKLPLPPITLQSFENNSSDPFAYFTFKKTFLNALAGIPNLTNAQKLIYLNNFVKGEALSTVEHVTFNDDGFKTAFDLLDFNFLNKEEIRDRTIDTILSLSEAKSLKEVETLIRAVNSKLHDLKSLNLDLLEVNSAGLVLVSKIVCNKLPRHFSSLSCLGKLVLTILVLTYSFKCIKVSSLGYKLILRTIVVKDKIIRLIYLPVIKVLSLRWSINLPMKNLLLIINLVKLRSNPPNVGFVVLLNTLLSIVRFIRQLMLGLS